MGRFESFEPFLIAACSEFQPACALEWGPGRSTRLLLDASPDVKLLSIEHDATWHDRILAQLHGHPRWELVLVPHSTSPGRARGYATYPLRRALLRNDELPRYDLIFIDGRARADCLTVARLIMSSDGITVLHDAERRAYREAMMLFPSHRFDTAGTTVALFRDPRTAQRFDQQLCGRAGNME